MSNKKNFATGTVLTPPSPTNSGLTLELQSGEGNDMPDVPFFTTATPPGVVPTRSNSEVLQVTDVTGDVLTFTREQKDTTAKFIEAGWRITNAVYTEDIDAKQDKAGSVFTITQTILSPTAADIIAWRAPQGAQITNVRAYRVGGSGAAINARKNGTDSHLASNLSVSSANTWMDGGDVDNILYAVGDTLEIRIISVSGTPTQLVIQVDFETV